jgi:hypothetical protein
MKPVSKPMPTFTRHEVICIGKDKSGQQLPDDVWVLQSGRLYGVFDGATSPTGARIDGVSAGGFAAWQCAAAAQRYALATPQSAYASADLLEAMSSALAAALQAHGSQPGGAATTAALALDAGEHLHFLLVGDSGVRINGREVVQVHKAVDEIDTAVRVALVRQAHARMAAAGASLSKQLLDALELTTRQEVFTGLQDSRAVLHTVTQQLPFMNLTDHSLGYAVLNGQSVHGPDLLMFSRPRAEVQSLEFFTDGYMTPGAEASIDSWEAAWQQVEQQDPHKTGVWPNIKSSTQGEHWDDRTLLIVRA